MIKTQVNIVNDDRINAVQTICKFTNFCLKKIHHPAFYFCFTSIDIMNRIFLVPYEKNVVSLHT